MIIVIIGYSIAVKILMHAFGEHMYSFLSCWTHHTFFLGEELLDQRIDTAGLSETAKNGSKVMA